VKPPQFEYEQPKSVAEALQIMADDSLENKPLAGGQSLVPLLNFRLARPDRLVDLNRVPELAYVRKADGVLHIGAMTRQAVLERSPAVAANWPLLLQALRWVAHPQIRNRGTVGGTIAHADPAAELPVAMTALDARVHVRSQARGARTIEARDLFVTNLMTCLEPDELLVEIEVPAVPERSGSAFVEYARRNGDYALGGAAVRVSLDADGACASAAIVLLGAGPVPLRASAAEQALAGRRLDESVAREAAARAIDDIAPTGDIHGSREYRRGLIETMVRRAVLQAAEEAS
jgi:carbon-monoxide dehydrogenase medium subunit/6-hydroxypseudooxynicotine dehydrogenase subunit alpha